MKLPDTVSCLTKSSFNLSGAERVLIEHRAFTELSHFTIRVAEVLHEGRALVHVQSDLGGRGAGVDRKNPEFTGLQRSPPGRWSSPCHPHSPPVMESGLGPLPRRQRGRTASRPDTSPIFRVDCLLRCWEPPCSRRAPPPDSRYPSPARQTPEVHNREQAGRKPPRHRTHPLHPSR